MDDRFNNSVEDIIEKLMSGDCDLRDILKIMGLSRSKANSSLREFMEKYDTLIKKYALPHDNTLLLCRELNQKLDDDPKNSELLWLFCKIICDKGLLREMGIFLSPEEKVMAFLLQEIQADMLQKMLVHYRECDEAFAALIADLRPVKLPSAETEPYEETFALAQIFADHWGGEAALNESLLPNLKYLVDMTHASPQLMSIAPLLAFRVMTLHTKRLREKRDFKFDVRKLWRYKEYRYDTTNSRVHRAMSDRVALYEALCEAYRENAAVDWELCVTGFTATSNLSDWYYEYCFWGDDDGPVVSEYIDIPVTEALLDLNFSCLTPGDHLTRLMIEWGGKCGMDGELFNILDLVKTYDSMDFIKIYIHIMQNYPLLESAYNMAAQSKTDAAMRRLVKRIISEALPHQNQMIINDHQYMSELTATSMLLANAINNTAINELLAAGQKLSSR